MLAVDVPVTRGSVDLVGPVTLVRDDRGRSPIPLEIPLVDRVKRPLTPSRVLRPVSDNYHPVS